MEERRENNERVQELERGIILEREELERRRELHGEDGKEGNGEVEVVMVKNGEDLWPARVVHRKRGRTVVERFCDEVQQRLSVSDAEVEPFNFSAKNERSEAAFKRARRFQRGQELIER